MTNDKTEGSTATDGAHILLFEDDETLAGLLARVLRTEGYHVDVLDDANEVPKPERLARYDVVLSDIHLANDTNGHDVLRRVHESSPAIPVILMTAYADIEGAMNAVGEGAYDYLAKPIEPTDLKRMVGEALARRKLAQSVDEGGGGRTGTQAAAQIVGTTPTMLSVYKTVAHVAPTTATVLIVGESGTGKELVARAIHAKSPRASKPFVAINCGALPESILESELFGHERGSFTGASATKHGVFEEAKGGTLFLDEIGEISPKMQVQLLRVLQEGGDPPCGRGGDDQGRCTCRRRDEPRAPGGGHSGAFPGRPALPLAGRDRPSAPASRTPGGHPPPHPPLHRPPLRSPWPFGPTNCS